MTSKFSTKKVFLLLFVCFLSIGHVYSIKAHVNPQRRLLNGTIILDQDEIAKSGDPLLNAMEEAIEYESSFIFTSGSIIKAFMRKPGRTLKGYLFSFMKKWDVYRHTTKKSSLFLLIPHSYKKEVLTDWKKCKTNKQSRINLSTAEAKKNVEQKALGLLIHNKKTVKKLNFLQLLNFIAVETAKEVFSKIIRKQRNHKLIQQFMQLFASRQECSGKWNFYQIGHGVFSFDEKKTKHRLLTESEGTICSLSISDYQKQLSFFQNKLDVIFFFLISCYSGGEKLFSPYYNTKPTNFYIAHQAGPDIVAAKSVYQTSRYFNILKSFNVNPRITVKDVVSTQVEVDEDETRLLVTIPFVRHPNSNHFFPVIVEPKKVAIISAKTKTNNIIVNKDKKVIFIAPTVVSQPITLTKPTTPPAFFSLFPGSAIHFIKQISLEDESLSPVSLLATSFFLHAAESSLAAQKIFLIKKFSPKNEEFRNVAILLDPVLSKKGILGTSIFLEQKLPNGKYGYSELVWNKKKKNFLLYQKTNPQDAFVKLHDAMENLHLIGYLKEQKEVLLFHKPTTKTTPTTLLPEMYGQEDYRTLLLIIGKLIKKGRWNLTDNPWDLLWSYVGMGKESKASVIRKLSPLFTQEEKDLVNKIPMLALLQEIHKKETTIKKSITLPAIQKELKKIENINTPINDTNETALHALLTTYNRSRSSKNTMQIIKLFLKERANINAQTVSGESPLHKIVDSFPHKRRLLRTRYPQKYMNLLRLFLSKPNIALYKPDGDGQTPLHIAAKYNMQKVAKMLLDKDRSGVNNKNKSSQTALGLARKAKHKKMMKLLQSYGAR